MEVAAVLDVKRVVVVGVLRAGGRTALLVALDGVDAATCDPERVEAGTPVAAGGAAWWLLVGISCGC